MDFEKGIQDCSKFKRNIKRNHTSAIIPARGGSKGIPRKNIKLLNGKPLISYSIEDAIKVTGINDVFVSSDDDEILSIAKKYGAKEIKRPQEISGDFSSSEAAIMHAIIEINNKFDFIPEYIVMLQPTSPLRNLKKIDEAINKIKTKNYNSSISVYKSHHLFWEKSANKVDWVSNYGNNRPMRQELSQYTEDGSLYVFNTLKFLSTANRIMHPVFVQINDQINSYEIDTLTDWLILESLVKNQK